MKDILKIILFFLIISYPIFLMATTNFFTSFNEVRVIESECSSELVYMGNPFMLALYCSLAISISGASFVKLIERIG